MNIKNDDYEIVDGVLYKVKKNFLPIPDGVTKIGYLAFDGLDCRGLVIPSSVETISDTAFRDCSFDTVEIPANVKKIGEYAFFCCHIKKVCISDGIEKMGISPFFSFGESYIEEVEIPIRFWENFRVIAEGIKFPKLKKVNFIGDGEEIPFDALIGCKSLNEVIIPNGVKKIGQNAFFGCNSLKYINLPDSLTIIDKGAFKKCTSLEEIKLPSNVQVISDSSFSSCTSLKKVNLNDGLTMIGKEAFKECTSLEEIKFPSGVQTIESLAFYKCTSLKKINFNEGLTEIGEGAFIDCKELEEIVLPGSIKKLNTATFGRCSSLKKVHFEEGLIEIGKGVFEECSLEEILLPSTTEIIEEYAFQMCPLLKKVKLNEGLTKIGMEAFYDCGLLEEIEISSSIKSIGDTAFDNCSSLKKVFLPKNISGVLGDSVFSNCSSLCEIIINNQCNILINQDSITIEYLDINNLELSTIEKIINSFDMKNINLKCPSYSLLKRLEKEKFKLLIEKGYNLSYIKDKSIKLPEYHTKKDEDDIESIKNEIIYLSKNFPENITNTIVKSVNDIYNSYRNGIDNFKPEYGKDNGNLFDYEKLKRNTYMKLFKIKNILNENKELVKFINEINECKKINDVRSYSPKNNIGDKISNILYFSSFLSNNNEYNNSTFKCLDEALDTASGYLTDRLNDNSVIMDVSILNQDLYKKIDEIFNKVLNDVKDIPKFKLTCLYNLVSGKEDINGIYENGIIYDISSIIEVINKLSDSVHKNKMKEELNTILNNNKDIISSSLNNNITEEEFNNIELKLRSDLSPLIEELDKYAKLDKYEDKDINIYRQIDMSFELIIGIRDLDDELSNYRHNDVLLEVINIIKRVNEKELNKDIREKVYSDVSNVLTAIKSLLSVTDISTKDKYIKFIAVATSLFGEVNSNIDKYIKSTNEYNSSFNIKK